MKTYKYLLTASLALLFVSCAKEKGNETATGGHTIIAEIADEKTTVQNGGSEVFWEAGDEMSVFYSGANLHYVCINKQPLKSAVFACTQNVVIATNENGENSGLIGLYPYNEYAWCEDDGTVVTHLTCEQLGRENSFGSGYNITMAEGKTEKLAYYNVCGGFRFSLTRSDITSVTLRGNNGEAIAGNFSAKFDNGVPVVQSVVSSPSTSIRLSLPGGAAFKPGVWYYIVSLPVNFSNGLTLRFESAEEYGEKVSSKNLTVQRGHFGNLANVDSGVEFHSFGSKDKWTVEGGGNVENVIDDQMLTYWTASSATLPVSLTIDTKVAREVDRFYFNQAWRQVGQTGISKLKIEYSNDKTSWTEALGETQVATNHSYTQGLLFSSGIVTARYFRITVTEAAAAGYPVQIGEVNFGTDTWTSGNSILWHPTLKNSEPSAGFKWHGIDPTGNSRWFTLDDWTHENSNGMTFDTAQTFQYTPNGTPVLFSWAANLANAKLFQTFYLLPGHYVLGVASIRVDNPQFIDAYLTASKGNTLTNYEILSTNPSSDSNYLTSGHVDDSYFSGDNVHKWTWIGFDLKEACNVSVGFVYNISIDATSLYPYTQYYWNGVNLVQQGFIYE